MKNINSELRKINKSFVKKIESDSKERQIGNNKKYDEDGYSQNVSKVLPLTLREQLSKNNKITMNFVGADVESTESNMDNLQLLVFFNGKLKYATKKGIFTFKTIKRNSLKRKGWKIYCETTEKDRIVFKNNNEYEKFIGFCTKTRECVKLQDMYHELCYTFVEENSNVEVEEVAEEVKVNVLPRVDLA